MINHDSSGFLIGQMVEVTRDLLHVSEQSLTTMRGVRATLNNIATHIGARPGYARKGSFEQPRPYVPPTRAEIARAATVRTSAPRVSRSRIGQPLPEVIALPPAIMPAAPSRGTSQAVALAKTVAAVQAQAAAAPAGRQRDASGRFSSTGGGAPAGGGDPSPAIPGRTPSSGSKKDYEKALRLAEIEAKDILGAKLAREQKAAEIAGSVKNTAVGAVEGIDPSIQAAREITSVMSPLGRAFGIAFGALAQRRKERWYKRILNAILRRNGVAAEGGSSGASAAESGSTMGIFAGLASRLGGPVMSVLGRGLVFALTRIFGPVAALWGAWKVGQWIGGKISDWLVSSGIQDKMFDAIDGMLDAWKKMTNWIASQYDNGKKAVKRAWAATVEWGGNLLNSIGIGIRHGAVFDGFDGAEGLSRGTYTKDEANRIRDLKKAGTNTGAFGKADGGMPDSIKEMIIAQATAMGVDPKRALKIAAMESGGNPNAVSTTGAIGVFQLIGQTASNLGVADRFDPAQNITGGLKLIKELQDRLGAYATDEAIYLAFQLGPEKAAEVIKGATAGKLISALSANTQSSVMLNNGSPAMSSSQFVQKQVDALNNRYNSVVGPMISVPSTVPTKIPGLKDFDVKTPMGATKVAPVKVSLYEPVTQNVTDRNIAHIVTGGLG
jgi:hypothetical protein